MKNTQALSNSATVILWFFALAIAAMTAPIISYRLQELQGEAMREDLKGLPASTASGMSNLFLNCRHPRKSDSYQPSSCLAAWDNDMTVYAVDIVGSDESPVVKLYDLGPVPWIKDMTVGDFFRGTRGFVWPGAADYAAYATAFVSRQPLQK